MTVLSMAVIPGEADIDAESDVPDVPEAPDDLADADEVAPMGRPSALPLPCGEAQLAGWIRGIVRQDQRALASFYDATASRIFGIVRRIVRRTALAEEVVEDTYLQVWRQGARFEASRGSAMTWLTAIARSRAIDAMRREARFQHEDFHDTSAHEFTEAPGSDELLHLARHQAGLHRALMQLGSQPRQLVSLAFFRGLSHVEIAGQSGLPLGTVKSQIRRALVSLRVSLEVEPRVDG